MAEPRRAGDGGAFERFTSREDGRAVVVAQTHVHVQAVAGELLVELRHEGERVALGGRDLLRGELVEHVAVRHLERRGVAQVDLVLARSPLALAELHRNRRRIDVTPDRADHVLDQRAREHVVVLDVALGGRQVPVALGVGLGIAVLQQEELELTAHVRVEAQRRSALELTLQDRPRRDRDEAAVFLHRIAQHDRRVRQPVGAAQGREVRHRVEIAVARLPARVRVAGGRVHLHVAGQQVVAHVHAVARHLVEEEARRDALADESPEEVGQRRDHRLDRAIGDAALEVLERETTGQPLGSGAHASSTSGILHSSSPRRDIDHSSSPTTRKSESWGTVFSSVMSTGYSFEKQASQVPRLIWEPQPRRPSSVR